MDEFQADIAITIFEELEDQLVDFLKVIPFDDANTNVWSPRLGTLIVESCGLIDSVWRHLSPPSIEIDGVKKDQGNYALPDYATMYHSVLNDGKVILLTSTPEYRSPFSIWSDASKVKSAAPQWWSVHNKLKHDRLENIKRATLNSAIDAVAGILIVLTSFSDIFAPSFIKKGWLELHGWSPKFAIEMATTKRWTHSFTLVTSLFAIQLGSKFPDDIRDFKPILYNSGGRLLRIFGGLESSCPGSGAASWARL